MSKYETYSNVRVSNQTTPRKSLLNKELSQANGAKDSPRSCRTWLANWNFRKHVVFHIVDAGTKLPR